jgi:hypothetical protein
MTPEKLKSQQLGAVAISGETPPGINTQDVRVGGGAEVVGRRAKIGALNR